MNISGEELIARAKSVFGAHLEQFKKFIVGRPPKNEIVARTVIRLYTAAIAVNFTDWMGKTLPWVHSKEANTALRDNLECEQREDHVTMLQDFAAQVGCLPGEVDYAIVARDVTRIRARMKDINSAGLCGLVLMTLLENLSGLFIPVLEEMAVNLGARDLTYTNLHGVADAEHSDAFREALKCELAMGRHLDAEHLVADTTELALNLLRQIFYIRT